MLQKKSIDNQAACDYAAYSLQESRLLPLELLRCYRELELSAEDAIRFLRLLAYCYDGRQLSVEDVMSEFEVSETEAAAILRPFVELRLLEADAAGQFYRCDGLRRELYLQWVNRDLDAEEPRNDLQGLAPTLPSEDESERIRALAHLYRRFEQELGRPLRYSESDRLRSWAGDEGFAPQLIEEALRRASVQDKCTLAYIGSILRSWQKKKLTSLEMVLAQDVKPESGNDKPRGGKADKADKADKNDKYAKVSIN